MSYSPPATSESPAARSQRQWFAWSLLAALVLLTALAAPFFAGRVYVRDDLGAFHLPVRAFYAEQLARGEPFDWMPQIYSGFYLTGEGQAGTYHPWHRLLYRFLPFQAALAWEWLSAYPFMLAGSWLFLRRRLHRRDAAMVGALLATFSGFCLLHVVHPNAVAIIAHIPWLLWAIDIVVAESSRRRVAAAEAGIALLTGSQILLGYPQYVWFSILAEAAYAGVVLATRRHAPRDGCGECVSCTECAGCGRSPWPRLVIPKGIGLLLGGVQWLPTLDSLLDSTRQTADAAFTSSGSLHPLNLVQVVAPYLFQDRVVGANTHELSVYLGAVPLMLVAWVVIRRRELGHLQPLVRAAAWLAAASVVLAMGEAGMVYRLQQYLPLIGRFRYPCRYLVLFQLSMAAIAAVGFLLLTGEGRNSPPKSPQDRQRMRRPFEAIWAIVFFSVAVAVGGLFLQSRPLIASWPTILAGPLLMAVAAGLVTATARGVRGAAAALIVFAAADLGYYGLSCSVYGQTERLDRYVATVNAPPAVAVGQAVPDKQTTEQVPKPNKPATLVRHSLTYGRVFAPPVEEDGARLWIGNQIILAGWPRTDGYTGLEPKKQLDYCCLPALRVASTQWVRRDEKTAATAGLIPCGDQWLQVPDPLPRVRLVNRAVVSDCPARDIQHIDIEHEALCEHPLALGSGIGDEPGQAELVAERPGRMAIEVHCESPQLLVVSESYHAGWQCMVNNAPRPLLRINGDFLGCVVQPGDETVILEFHPASLARGWLAMFAGLGLLGLCFVHGAGLGRSRGYGTANPSAKTGTTNVQPAKAGTTVRMRSH
jgi:hypothetical protein